MTLISIILANNKKAAVKNNSQLLHYQAPPSGLEPETL